MQMKAENEASQETLNQSLLLKSNQSGNLFPDNASAHQAIKITHSNECFDLYQSCQNRIDKLKEKLTKLKLSPSEVVIVIACADDGDGKIIANMVSPHINWQIIRDRDERPVAKNLAKRSLIQEILYDINKPAAKKLKSCDDLAVVIFDCNTVEVYSA